MPYLGSLKISVVDCPWARMRLHWFLKGMEFTRSSCSSQGRRIAWSNSSSCSASRRREGSVVRSGWRFAELGFVAGSLVVGYRLKCKHCCSGALKLRYQSWIIGSYMDDMNERFNRNARPVSCLSLEPIWINKFSIHNLTLIPLWVVLLWTEALGVSRSCWM